MFLLRPFRSLLGVAGRTRRTLATIPDVLESILVLPSMAEQLVVIRRNTDSLPGVLSTLEEVKWDTQVLPKLHEEFVITNAGIARMQDDTAALALHIPKLVVMESSLPKMAASLDDVEQHVEQLAHLAEPLEGAAERVGRMNERWSRRNGAKRLSR